MKCEEQIRCGAVLCSGTAICGSTPEADYFDRAFQENNIGLLNSGWKKIYDTSGNTVYQYINVENVTSDTINLTRINNNIIAEIPNIYGVKLALDSTTGELSLLGRNINETPVKLSSVNFQLGMAITKIEWSVETHSITFKIKNSEDIVIDLYDLLEMSNYYSKSEIDEMIEKLTPKTQEDLTNPTPDIELVNNMDITYGVITSGSFTIPADCNHGYISAISFKTISSPAIYFNYSGELTKKYIINGGFLDESQLIFSMNCQYDIVIICDGVEVKIYIQELAL